MYRPQIFCRTTLNYYTISFACWQEFKQNTASITAKGLMSDSVAEIGVIHIVTVSGQKKQPVYRYDCMYFHKIRPLMHIFTHISTLHCA